LNSGSRKGAGEAFGTWRANNFGSGQGQDSGSSTVPYMAISTQAQSLCTLGNKEAFTRWIEFVTKATMDYLLKDLQVFLAGTEVDFKELR
jgi:hypothetical protein